ncbi:amino acid ABC transporter permease [Sagittula stellata]|uniref:ABC transporter, membrane spanning protein n=1 Tax=Sagittula stellata (strain ATCC 700073 / DSM 11524 / E-37) TaxID=388399 RepID=A3K4F6_SAGS3|nr:amino acid ABC transporter permease [Sagittula stellata]EBA07855.1 ABC transporter, membrane spanning protein [Sagittula stellata E-37]
MPFDWIIDYWDILVLGAARTIALTLLAIVVAAPLSILLGWALASGPRRGRWPINAYVEVFRNTPYMIHLFFIFFALPRFGIGLDPYGAAVASLCLMVAAFGTKIVESGLRATPPGQTEAALSLGFNGAQAFYHVQLVPALARVWPALCSLATMALLDSAVVSLIAVEELTWATTFIETRNFRSFETFFFSSLLFLLISFGLRRSLMTFGERVVARGLNS